MQKHVSRLRDQLIHHITRFAKLMLNFYFPFQSTRNYNYSRYKVDNKYDIVIVKNSIKILRINEVDAFIQWELLKHFEFLTLLSFKLRFYDEKLDKIMLLEAFKVVILTIKKIF